MFATECSKPAMTKNAMGRYAPMARPMVFLLMRLIATAMHTRTLHRMPRTTALPKVRAHFPAATFMV